MSLNCRHWPPFYEEEINGKCVKVPQKTRKSSPLEGVLAVALIVVIVSIPLYVVYKVTSSDKI